MIRFFILAVLVTISAAARGQTLGVALNATNLTWTTSGTGGAFGWTAQSSTSHDGVSAAASDLVRTVSQSSTVQTSVTGPGTLSFWWRNPSGNLLSFVIGTITVASITSYSSWQQRIIYLGTGTQTLKWTLSYVSPGDTINRSYLDEVSYTPGATAPVITTQPQGQSQVPGINATFTVVGGGTPPASYQWQFNEVDIPGATAVSLTVTNIQITNLGVYRVIITNELGSIVSSNAPLEFGEVTGWGANQLGQALVPIGVTNILAVAAGNGHNLALKADGRVIAWGWNQYGQTNVPDSLTNVWAVSAGNTHNLALKADGTVTFWGSYPLGDTNMPGGLTNVVAVAAGGNHNVALKADGTMIAWGWNQMGQTNVPAGLTGVVAIRAGSDHNLALKRDGTVVAWGYNNYNKATVPGDLTSVIAVEAGEIHSLALRSDGTVVGWGYGGYGLTSAPADATNGVAIRTEFLHNLALRADGTVIAWGLSLAGRTNVPAGLSNAVAVAAGRDHSLALVGNAPPTQAAMAVNPSWTGGVFTLSLPSQSGRVFALEYKDSLTDVNWTALPLVAGNGGTVVLTDSTATTSQRFYRVRRW